MSIANTQRRHTLHATELSLGTPFKVTARQRREEHEINASSPLPPQPRLEGHCRRDQCIETGCGGGGWGWEIVVARKRYSGRRGVGAVLGEAEMALGYSQPVGMAMEMLDLAGARGGRGGGRGGTEYCGLIQNPHARATVAFSM